MDRGPLGMVLKMSRVVGVAPFTCAPEFQISRPLVMCGRTLFFFNAILNYSITAGVFIQLKYNGVLSALQGIKIIGTILFTTLNTLGAFTAPARLMRMANYLKKLDQIDIKLHKHSKSDLKSNSNYKIPILIGIYFLLQLMYVIADLYLHANNNCLMKISIFFFTTNLYISLLLQLQIIYFVQRANFTLIAINDNLQRLIFDDNIDTRTAPRSSPKQDNEENIPHKIRDLATFYGFICDIVKKNNEADGMTMLLSIMFLALLLEVHIFAALAYNMSDRKDIYSWLFKIYPIFCALYTTFYIIYWIEQFHRTHYEMERTHNLIIIGKSRKDEVKTNHEFELFFRMVILNSVRYSPLDMVTLDRPLVMKLFSALVTYLVIMLQYAPEMRSSFQFNNTTTDRT